MDLSGKAALVTGGGIRLGKGIALALAGQRVRVVVHYNRSGAGAEDTVQQIRALGVEAVAIQADLALAGMAPDLIRRAIDALGPLDFLINSAAIFDADSPTGMTEASWDEQFAVNLKAPFFLSLAFAAQVGRERRAHVLNVADASVGRPAPAHLIYRLTKAALVHMTKDLAIALAPNIQVNAIAPGAILPPVGQGQAYMDELAKKIPALRVGSPEELAKALLYLLHSDFVTGEIIYVSGGAHL
ncbi:MAG: SDR family oxidoreductase [Anaerolineales bacterium]|jgi:NAD(P)-dependent dehydrogenase (short-subunit alcohol dehydrogenase family)